MIPPYRWRPAFRWRPALAGLLLATLLFGSASVSVAEDQNQRFVALIGLARVKRDAGDAAAARKFFEQAQRVHALAPAELAEYFWVVAGLDAKAALAAGRTLLGLSPKDDNIRERVIGLAVVLGDEALATEVASEGHRLTGDPRWSRRLAESALRSGRPSDAADAYRQATTKADAQVQDRIGLALSLEAARQYGDAVAVWTAVPASVRDGKAEWIASRFRALAFGAPAAVAGPELESWLSAHPGSGELRELLVDIWTRDGKPDRALLALTPLLEGPDRERWRHREAELARAARDDARAIGTLESLVRDGLATTAEQWALAELLLTVEHFERAEAMLGQLSRLARGCDERFMDLVDRVPGARGTSLLVAALHARSCSDRPKWIVRGIDRTAAAADHREALALVATLPDGEAQRPTMRRTYGQLRLWTGDTAGAIETLEDVLVTDPGDAVARDALVDAHRAAGDAAAAWRTAQPLLASRPSPERLETFAELALEADQPQAVPAIVEQLTATAPAIRDGLLGRASLAVGRPADAARILERIPLPQMTPAVALAAIDATTAMQGRAATLDLSRQFFLEGTEWQDVLARRIVIEASAGHPDEADRLARALAAIEPELGVLAAAERALADERPQDALQILSGPRVGSGFSRISNLRADDLRATALVGIGDLKGALEVLTALEQARPTVTSFAVRRAELAWQTNPDATTRQAVLALTARFPDRLDARVTAARVLAAEERHQDALNVLAGGAGFKPAPTTFAQWPVEVRLVAARSLHALGRSAEALALLEHSNGLAQSAALFHAQLVAAVNGADRAYALFKNLAADRRATPDVYAVWADATPAAAARAAILKDGSTRFPDRSELFTRLATVLWAIGNADGARDAAARAVALNGREVEAWFVLVDATQATRTRTDVSAVVERFARAAGGDAALLIQMAERTAGMVRDGADPVLATALSLLDGLIVIDQLAIARDMARARLFAATGNWTPALAAIDAALTRDAGSPPALRLRAEVLSWSGRHLEAIEAYDRYLALAPLDLDARRQQARVAGWSGRYSEARRLYTTLRAAFPDNKIIAAEADAKAQLFAGRWRSAATAYRRWVALEPGNSEARFELAEVLRTGGNAASADAVLEGLAADAGHRLAAAARQRAEVTRLPSLTLVTDHRSSSGYAGTRLLDLQETGAAVARSFRPDGSLLFAAEGARVLALGDTRRRNGVRLALTAVAPLSPSWRVEGRGAWWSFTGSSPSVVDVQARLAWRPADQWTLSAGAVTTPLFENLTTIDRGMSASGPFAAAERSTPQSSVALTASRQRLSDGNWRNRATLSATRSLSERVPELRVVGWGELLSYRDRSADYFTPVYFLHVDGGLEYTQSFGRPRFGGDRRRTLSASYLFGADDGGTTYQHPTIRLFFELNNGVAIDAHADWIRSATYDESAIAVGLRIGGVNTPPR